MSGEAEQYELRPLDSGDTFGSLKSGSAEYSPLKQFARQKIHKYEKANLARTYVIIHVNLARVAAYITLVCSEVLSKQPLVNGEDVDFPHDHYPAVKIARLMVDERYRRGAVRRNFGTKLVEFALGTARTEICPAVGCRFVVVDAKAASVDFYAKCGFTMVDTDANKSLPAPVMFIDLHKTTS